MDLRPAATAAPLVAALAVVSLSAFPAPALAADDQPSMTYVCRPAIAGEFPNAQMTANGDEALTCRPVGIALKMSNGSLRIIGRTDAQTRTGPDLSKALTPGQINDAWVKYIEKTFNIQHTS